MYTVTRLIHVRLDGGRSVVLQPGPRGMGVDPDGNPVDLDANLRRALPSKILDLLLQNGSIDEE